MAAHTVSLAELAHDNASRLKRAMTQWDVEKPAISWYCSYPLDFQELYQTPAVSSARPISREPQMCVNDNERARINKSIAHYQFILDNKSADVTIITGGDEMKNSQNKIKKVSRAASSLTRRTE